MKRLFSTIISMCIITCAIAQSEFDQNGISYSVNPNQKDVTVERNSNGYTGNIVIPAKVTNDGKTYNVTHIGDEAFKKSSITSITLPEGLIEIGEASFRECQQLKAIVIPSTVVNINSEAFIFCFSLSSLTFKGKTRPTIGSNAFGKTLIKKPGINTGIPANMAVPDKDTRYNVNKSSRCVVY